MFNLSRKSKDAETVSAGKTEQHIQPQAVSPRYHLLDTVRGILIIGVVIFHAILDLTNMGLHQLDFLRVDVSLFMHIIQVIGIMLFILISGICSRLSRNNLKRGLIALGLAMGISVVTYVFDRIFGTHYFIYIGILHMFGFCMVLSHFVLKLVPTSDDPEKRTVWPAVGAVVFLLLFAVTFNMKDPGYGIGIFNWHIPMEGFPLYGTLFGNILGFSGYSVPSADYFPLIPWTLAFFAGMCLGGYFKRGQAPKIFTYGKIRPLAFVGRHSLIVYIAHQPIIYGICALVGMVL